MYKNTFNLFGNFRCNALLFTQRPVAINGCYKTKFMLSCWFFFVFLCHNLNSLYFFYYSWRILSFKIKLLICGSKNSFLFLQNPAKNPWYTVSMSQIIHKCVKINMSSYVIIIHRPIKWYIYMEHILCSMHVRKRLHIFSYIYKITTERISYIHTKSKHFWLCKCYKR